ncbi:hypothetical protein ABW21_db0201728 [Orbilia brochopaga]|nr:hypothetical protein ABW21_db0201728 [Drechslerella brochopaga]
MDQRFVGCPMNYTVASCYYLARIMLNEGDWNIKHIHYSGYIATQLQPAVSVLVEMMGFPKTHHQAVYNKYNDKKFKRVANFVERWMAVQFPQIIDPPRDVDAEYGQQQPRTRRRNVRRAARREREPEPEPEPEPQPEPEPEPELEPEPEPKLESVWNDAESEHWWVDEEVLYPPPLRHTEAHVKISDLADGQFICSIGNGAYAACSGVV